MIREIKVTNNQIWYARDKIMKVVFNNNLDECKFGSDLERTFFGYLGQKVVVDHLSGAEDTDDFEFDVSWRSKRIEVKTISCRAEPRMDYLCTVNSPVEGEGMRKQDADFYVFLRIAYYMSRSWVCGFIPCDEFYDRGQYYNKGELNCGGVNFNKANCTVLEISKLTDIMGLKGGC